MTDTQYIFIMVAKLIDALDRKDTMRDGNWGYPPFSQEIVEMKEEIFSHPIIQNAPQEFLK